MVIKFTVPAAKPRNPIAAVGRHRGAGVHGLRNPRQQDRRTLQIELAQLEKPPHTR